MAKRKSKKSQQAKFKKAVKKCKGKGKKFRSCMKKELRKK